MLLRRNPQSFHLFSKLAVVNLTEAASQLTHSTNVGIALLLKLLSKFTSS